MSLRERETNAELRQGLGIKDIDEVVRRSRLRWMGHVLRKDKDDWVRRSMEMIIEGKRGVGRLRTTWLKAVESDMRVKGLMRKDARIGQNGGLCYGEQKTNSYNSRKKSLLLLLSINESGFYLWLSRSRGRARQGQRALRIVGE